MENYLFGILGIVVSITLFLIGYRQTVGAKRERITAANNDIEKILLRRIVIENYTPNITDISRLIEGKARDFKVKINDLYSEEEFLNILFTRILETDFLNQDQRDQIYHRIYPVLIDVESKPIEESEIVSLKDERKAVAIKSFISVFLAILASIIGGLVSLIPELKNINSKEILFSSTTLWIVGVSFSILIIIIVINKIKELQEKPNDKKTAIQKYLDFENEVLSILEKHSHFINVTNYRDKGYDFLIEKGKGKIIIEVKNWSKQIPQVILKRTLERINDALKKEEASEAIIVTKVPVEVSQNIIGNSPIKIMSSKEFKNYLVHNE